MIPTNLLQLSSISPYNPLTLALIFLAAGAIVAAIYLLREAREDHDPAQRESFAWLFGLLGFFALLVSGELFWANWAGFPAGPFTELFGVANTLYAAVLLTAAFVLYKDIDPRPFAWLTAVAGLVLLQGARAIWTFQMTRSPGLSTGIWAGAGLASLLLLPAAYLEERSGARRFLLYAITGLLIIVALLAGITGLEAHYGHIAEQMAGR